ncbi:2OG-Fe(II) oxygenase [Cupriavidus sp. 30B13]|uniref:2OG-Fe(II) oxygenase n=1 Tax=Cupriavidus sp. 30B13 TaxID=3384241 RepID=UPI003B8F1656
MIPKMESAMMPVPCWIQRPEVQQATILSAESAHTLAEIVMNAHHLGHSVNSRTRYASQAKWDINMKFRSSRNIPTRLDGLEHGFNTMQTFAERSMPAFGLSEDLHTLVPVDDQCLLYETGDYVRDHADDSALVHAEHGCQVWRAVKPDRHLVGIVWLTSQCEDVVPTCGEIRGYAFSGGELRVNSLIETDTGLPLCVRPQAGTMVLFPASPWFRHEVLPVRGGTRVALTRWWKVCAKDSTDH